MPRITRVTQIDHLGQPPHPDQLDRDRLPLGRHQRLLEPHLLRYCHPLVLIAQSRVSCVLLGSIPSSLGFVSLFGNIVIGISSVLVIVYFSRECIRISSYGGITYGFHWDNSLLWCQHPMDVAVIFGIFCYALCIIFIGPTSKVCPRPLSEWS